jgi:hypothetical protein
MQEYDSSEKGKKKLEQKWIFSTNLHLNVSRPLRPP